MSEGPLFAYRAMRRAGDLQPDPMQELAAEKLQGLCHALAGYQPASGTQGWAARLGFVRRAEPPPQGLYIHGPVGRGKSMLMDLFFRHAPVERKRRVHFHAFMIEVHDAVHAWRQDSSRKNERDPLPQIAQKIAADAWLLCFDEFHVNDIADAMILGRLFTALFDCGVVVVTTSNYAPDELYKNGLQRQRFLPFIALLKERLDCLELASPVDYRLARLKAMRVYHSPLGPGASPILDRVFRDLADGAEARPDSIAVKGRQVAVDRAANGVALFSFDALCARPLGAEDYLAIGRRYHTILLDGVPQLGEDRRNEAKRFMTLVDVLYDLKVNLVMAAAVPPQDLYRGETHGKEFQRTVSRLMEMQTDEYLGAAHQVAAE